MIWSSKELSVLTKKIEILPKVASDHNPLMWSTGTRKASFMWRINEDLLNSEETVEQLKKETKEYFKLNLNNDVNICVVWDAYKAILRGLLMKFNWEKKKKKEIKLKEIQELIYLKEQELKKRSKKKKKTVLEIKILQKQLETILMEEINRNIKCMKQKFFEQGDRPEKLLAWQIKERRKKTIISKLKINGDMITNQEKIKISFVKFFESLYRNPKVEKKDIENYLQRIDIPEISPKLREELNKEIDEEEIIEALKSTNRGKAPGPDGFISLFYKKMTEEIGPVFKNLINSIIETKNIPASWKEAHITLIHKEGQDPTDMKNYCPISLLNEDYKLFAKILATRVKKVLLEFITEDQTGFLPSRQLRDNVRMIVNTIEYYDKKTDREMALFFIDAEKAFNNLTWPFMFQVMSKLNLGEYFCNAVTTIYQEQSAKIRINNDLTRPIKICKGTRQGCPLSPLLFVMTLEILLRDIRADDKVKGLRHKGYQYKLRAFA